jgi:hypothetical protein
MSFVLPKTDAMEGAGLGFDIVIGNEPEIGVRLAFGGPFLVSRRMAMWLIETSREESRIDAMDGVCSPTENQSLLLSSELGKRSSEW